MRTTLLILGLMLLAAGCTVTQTATQDAPASGQLSDTGHDDATMEDGADSPSSPPDWFSVELIDVNSGATYTLNDFRGTPVLLESFAVWCPTCARQQREIKALHESLGESAISVALDTDPNEDAQKVRDHAARNGFAWRYSVSPTSLTQSLIDEFGTGIVNAPSVPMVLICPDQHYRMLGRGVKDVSELQDAVESCG